MVAFVIFEVIVKLVSFLSSWDEKGFVFQWRKGPSTSKLRHAFRPWLHCRRYADALVYKSVFNCLDGGQVVAVLHVCPIAREKSTHAIPLHQLLGEVPLEMGKLSHRLEVNSPPRMSYTRPPPPKPSTSYVERRVRCLHSTYPSHVNHSVENSHCYSGCSWMLLLIRPGHSPLEPLPVQSTFRLRG